MAVAVDFEIKYSIKTHTSNTNHKKIVNGKHEKDVRKKLERFISINEPDAELTITNITRKKVV